MPLERANQVFQHPMHQEAYRSLVQLIIDLRQCNTYGDYYHFQHDLLDRVLKVQGHRYACRREIERLTAGKSISDSAPDLPSGASVSDVDDWQLEVDVCERVDRQLRSIADAMAWRVFNFDRSVIVGLSRNQHPGPMFGKKGLVAERREIEKHWIEERSFVLMHDLTNCLSIGDGTLFKTVGTGFEAYLLEIKSNPRRTRSDQARRQRLAERAIRDGGPLPNDPNGRLIRLAIPYRTHLGMLRDAFRLAHDRGVQPMKIPAGRALIAADLRRGYELWPEEEFLTRSNAAYLTAVRRARINGVGHHVNYRSDDLVGRSPVAPPWAIYPLPADVCAGLIADLAFYAVSISSHSLLMTLRDAGLSAEWMLPPGKPQLEAGDVIVRIRRGTRAVDLRPSEMQRLLLELMDVPTWIESIHELLSLDHFHGNPWPYFADEWKTWV